MNVKDLKEILKDLPDDMEILETRYSDYGLMAKDSWSVVNAVPCSGDWFMREHETMSEENKANKKPYLHYEGN